TASAVRSRSCSLAVLAAVAATLRSSTANTQTATWKLAVTAVSLTTPPNVAAAAPPATTWATVTQECTASRPAKTPVPPPRVSNTSGQPTVPYDQCAIPNRCRGATPAVAAIDAANTTPTSGHRHRPSGRCNPIVAATTSATAANTAIATTC